MLLRVCGLSWVALKESMIGVLAVDVGFNMEGCCCRL